jgi:hypothetical protein
MNTDFATARVVDAVVLVLIQLYYFTTNFNYQSTRVVDAIVLVPREFAASGVAIDCQSQLRMPELFVIAGTAVPLNYVINFY